jgi:O-antigen ligase
MYQDTQNQNQPSKLLNTGGYITALLMLSIPLSTTITIIFSFILFFLWLVSLQFLTLPTLLKSNPVALFAFLLLFYLIIGISYSSVPLNEAFSILGKYREFLLLIVLIPFLQSETARKLTWQAMAVGSIITLLSSYAMQYDLINAPHPHKSPNTLKTYITHGLFVAFFAFYCAHKVLQPGKYRMLYLALVILSTHNLFFIVFGRTGQLIYLLLLLLFCLQRLSKKATLLSVLLVIIFLSLYLNYSENALRIREGFTNLQSLLQSQSEDMQTSIGQRITFIRHTLTIIKASPWFGHGTGSYSHEYQKIAANDIILTSNPHNEYLMITAQLGITGLLLFIGFLISQYRCSFRLTNESKWLAQGVLLTLAINSMLNSSFLDHTEGHWFACLVALCFAPLSEKKTSGQSLTLSDSSENSISKSPHCTQVSN